MSRYIISFRDPPPPHNVLQMCRNPILHYHPVADLQGGGGGGLGGLKPPPLGLPSKN